MRISKDHFAYTALKYARTTYTRVAIRKQVTTPLEKVVFQKLSI